MRDVMGWLVLAASGCVIDRDGDGVAKRLDCDDRAASVFPFAPEECDGIDNDCDGQVDEDVKVDGFADEDGDGAGGEAVLACRAVLEAGDCDDGDPGVRPGAVETCDGIDQDCDGVVDDDPSDGLTAHPDEDGDGYGALDVSVAACSIPPGHVEDGTDCDDSDAGVNPGEVEVCDSVDTDCDGVIPELRVPEDHATVQDAIDAALAGDMICVGPGTWERFDFRGKAVLVHGVEGAGATIVDAGGTGRALTFSFDEGPDSVLSGFTLTGGSHSGGAGLTVSGASPTLTDLVVTDNVCTIDDCRGAGVLIEDGAAPLLQRVVVTNNRVGPTFRATAAGVAVAGAAPVWEDCEITDNTLEVSGAGLAAGGGLYVDAESVVELRRCTLARNGTVGFAGNFHDGGAVWVGGGSRLTIENSRIADNHVAGGYARGAAIAVTNYSLLPRTAVVLENVIVAGNHAGSGASSPYGVGVYGEGEVDVTIRNSAFVGNEADGDFYAYGIAIAAEVGGRVSVTNSVFTDQSYAGDPRYVEGSVAYGRSAAFAFAWSDFWGNDSPEFGDIPDPIWLDGNVAYDPLFTDTSDPDPLQWDLTPLAGSPLVDAGDPVLLDADGTPSDIGPYGGPLGASW